MASDGLPRLSDDFAADKRFHPAPIPPQRIGNVRKLTAQLFDRNGLVRDPIKAHHELQHINPWTDDEKELFLTRFVVCRAPGLPPYPLPSVVSDAPSKLRFTPRSASRFLSFPKKFSKIAQAMPYKSVAECVKYYYTSKKEVRISFCRLFLSRPDRVPLFSKSKGRRQFVVGPGIRVVPRRQSLTICC
jgi:hypothetical protein